MRTVAAFTSTVNPIPAPTSYYTILWDSQVLATGYLFAEAMAVLAALNGLGEVQAEYDPAR